METVERDAIAEIESKVAFWIDGVHSRIGVILPEEDPAPDDVNDLYRTLAEIAINQAKKKAAQKG